MEQVTEFQAYPEALVVQCVYVCVAVLQAAGSPLRDLFLYCPLSADKWITCIKKSIANHLGQWSKAKSFLVVDEAGFCVCVCVCVCVTIRVDGALRYNILKDLLSLSAEHYEIHQE